MCVVGVPWETSTVLPHSTGECFLAIPNITKLVCVCVCVCVWSMQLHLKHYARVLYVYIHTHNVRGVY